MKLISLWIVLTLWLVGGCAPAATPTVSLTAPTLIPSPMASLPTPIWVPTPRPGEAWNYVVLGDSSSWGFPKFYVQSIEADLGVKVRLIDWTSGGLTSRNVLDNLRNNQKQRQDVSNAQIVTFYGNPVHIVSMSMAGASTNRSMYDCSARAVEQYKSELSGIADEIFILRKGQPTIIRTYTRFTPFYASWKEQGMFDEYRRCAAALDEAIMQVGREHGVLVADTGLALNGPNHDQDPNDKGYLIDGIHENEVGAQIVAEVFRKLGYAAVIP